MSASDKLLATEHAADAIASRYGNGPLACKIQEHVAGAVAAPTAI